MIKVTKSTYLSGIVVPETNTRRALDVKVDVIEHDGRFYEATFNALPEQYSGVDKLVSVVTFLQEVVDRYPAD